MARRGRGNGGIDLGKKPEPGGPRTQPKGNREAKQTSGRALDKRINDEIQSLLYEFSLFQDSMRQVLGVNPDFKGWIDERLKVEYGEINERIQQGQQPQEE